jgi:hypothetical protein
MLTQLRPLNSTTVEIDVHPNGYGVLLAGNLIGSFELFPVWGLTDTQYTSALALGLDVSDECYMFNGQVFITQAQAAANVIGEHLASTAVWTIPDYI